MSDFKKCEKCKQWHRTNIDCLPVYLVYYEDYMGYEPKKIHANSHEDAALKFAEHYNVQCDYCLMNETILVRVEKDGEIKQFTVGAEQDIHYSATES